MNKKLGAIALSAVMVGATCAFTACDLGGNGADKKLAYVSLDINPAIELIVDRDNNVVSVRGENEDGQVLLYEETGIKGENIEIAIEKITNLAVELGYLDENNKVVDTIVTAGDGEFASGILSKVNASVTATAENLGLSVTTDGEGAYSLIRKMEEYKAQFPNNKAIQNMSVSKFKLALSVSETGEISLDAAVKLDDAELVGMLKETSLKMEEYATKAFTEAKTKALAVYEQATEIAGYAVYGAYYLEKLLSHPMTAYYGGMYQMYATASKGFDVICDVAYLASKVENYPLNEEQVQAVATALGMESVDALKNSDGEITVDSIEAYADKMFKNTPASEALENTKAALSEALAQSEKVIKEKAGELSAEYRQQIESAIESAKQVQAAVENSLNILPENLRVILDNCTKDFKDIMSNLSAAYGDGSLDLDDLRGFADGLDKKANEYYNKMKADLSEEEWAEVQDRRAAAIEKMSAQKKALEKALDEAANAAKDYLAELKQARKNKA